MRTVGTLYRPGVGYLKKDKGYTDKVEDAYRLGTDQHSPDEYPASAGVYLERLIEVDIEVGEEPEDGVEVELVTE